MRDYRQSAINAMYLIMVQGVSYLVPLFLMAHLIKNLGVAGFGEYAFWYSVLLFVQALVDYGFSFSGTREVATTDTDSQRITAVFYQVTIVKLSIGGLCMAAATAGYIGGIVERSGFYAIFAGVLLGFVPNWFFQGLQRLRGITLLSVGGRLGFIVAVYLLIDEQSSIDDVVFLQFFSLLPVVMFGNYLACRQLSRYVKPSSSELMLQLRTAWPLFSTTILSMVISNGGILWLGAVGSAQTVGAYAAVERVIKAILGMFAPISQAIYPLNSKRFSNSLSSGLRSATITGSIMMLLVVIAIIVVALTKQIWFNILSIPVGAKDFVMPLLIWAFFSVLNNVLGIQILSACGAAFHYALSFKIAAVVFAVVLISEVFGKAALSVTSALVISEIVLALLLTMGIVRLAMISRRCNGSN